MNPSYGDSTNSAHGRARVSGLGGGYDDENTGYDNAYDPYSPPARPAGRASVTGDLRTGDSRSGHRHGSTGAIGSASVGSASVGSASVAGGPTGRAPVSGRASVGRASAAGRASVGGYSDDPYGEPGGPGGPGGPEGPRGPGGPRSGRSRGKKGPRSKRARRRNIALAVVAVFIMLGGIGVVGVGYYFDSVPLPNQTKLPESTLITYAGGEPMAKIGDQNRTIVGNDQIPIDVQRAVVAAEDNTFYTNSGVDAKGILRAAWNNVTGGSRQGASTITQQYVRKAFDLKGVSYARKTREAVMAMKIDQQYSKADIMGFYLNIVYFGRGSWGIEAAAEAYFGKHTKELTVEEGMVLAGLIKQPEGADGYDPAKNLNNAKDRWANYVKPNMVKLGFLDAGKAAAMQFPTNFTKPDPNTASGASYGKDTPTGFVVHHVMDELSHQTDVNLGDLQNGGYRIVTTIKKPYEDAAISVADPTVKGSVMSTQPTRLEAGLVAIEPTTGRVQAYYAGHDGSGLDYAGIYNDPVLSDGQYTGAHFPPGSTMKVYTMTTALTQHISIDSYWDGPAKKVFPGRGDDKALRNGGPGPVTNSEGDACPAASNHTCTMQYALQVSTNTVFYGVGQVVGPDKIIDVAHAMGVQHIWAPVNGVDKRFDLANTAGKDIYPQYAGGELAIGQYGITVQDNAAGAATLAAGGVHAETHFVDAVYKGADLVYKGRTKQTKMSDAIGLTREEVDDATWAMSTVIQSGTGSKDKLANARPAAAKTGTWQLCTTCDAKDKNTGKNSDAWFTGFTPQLAATVHVGSTDVNDRSAAYYDGNHKEKAMNGADTPGAVWKKFMDKVLNNKPKAPLPQPKHVGDTTKGNAQSPDAPPPGTDPNNPGGGNGGGNGGNGGNGGGNGNGVPCIPPSPLCTPPTKNR